MRQKIQCSPGWASISNFGVGENTPVPNQVYTGTAQVRYHFRSLPLILLFAAYYQTSVRVPTTTRISYIHVTLDISGGDGQIVKFGSGRIKISSTLSYFDNSVLFTFLSYFPPCACDTSTSRLGYNHNNSGYYILLFISGPLIFV